MSGKKRVIEVFAGRSADPPPVMPIIHTGLAKHAGIALGRYFTDPEAMAEVIIEGFHRFGFDGVQLSLGITAEAEALGARVDQPPDGSPLLKQYLLADPAALDDLRRRDPAAGGRLPLYQAAVRKVADRIGSEAFVLSTLRGPLNIASQLRGVEDLLIDMLQKPDEVRRLLDFTTDVAIRVSQTSLGSGADGLVFGEATCSPSFISPDLYRRLVHPCHTRLMAGVHSMGWTVAGWHICGNIRPIIPDLIATGADFLDVDYQVPAAEAVALTAGRVALRGNLDPTAVFLFGDADRTCRETAALCRAAAGARWIMSSGCDVPPGVPAENLSAFVQTARSSELLRR